MIDVRNLTKIYKSDKTEVVALNSVSFHLPDKGLVFIVGKSGSGKSTLLNMLGVLDDITSGEVIVDGKNIAHISDHDANACRNSTLGIVYQNYNLFENETVQANIRIGVGVSDTFVTDEKIDEMLNIVELDGIKTKKVKNLSGGQKQRVAIARALVKDPKLILADEPTGNLDSKTAKTIFDLFKKVSKDKLVVIITHDIKSAYEYADRLIRLSDGEIVEDVIKNERYVEKLSDDYIYIDSYDPITEEKIDEINKISGNSHRKLKKLHKKFRPYKTPEVEPETGGKFDETRMNFKQALLLGLKVLKHNKFSLIVTSILTILIIALLSLSTAFINFEGTTATRDVVKIYGSKSIVMKKGYSLTNKTNEIEKDYIIEAKESDLVPVKEQKYKGNSYPIYTVSLPISSKRFVEGSYSIPGSVGTFYIDMGLGVVKSDNKLLQHLFGENFELAAGSLYGLDKSTKVIITDYFADAMIYYVPDLKSKDPNDPYAQILNRDIYGTRYIVGAVLKTDYKEKHQVIFDIHKKMVGGYITPKDASELIAGTRTHQIFEDDVLSRLGYAFTINPKFIDDYYGWTGHAFTGYSFAALSETATSYEYQQIPNSYAYKSEELEGDDVTMSVDVYNKLFGTAVVNKTSPDFSEKTIYLHNFGFDQDIFSTPKHSTKIVIKDVFKFPETSGPIMYTSSSKLVELEEFLVFPYAFMFDDVYDSFAIYEGLVNDFYYCPMHGFDAVFNTINISNIFNTIFTSIFIVLIAVELLLVVLHTNKTINKEKYAFGVYKTLGYSNRHLTLAMIIANVIMILGIFIFATVATLGLSFMANYFLQDGFYMYTSNMLYYDLRILGFKFGHVAMYASMVLGFMILAFSIPLLKIRRIKPSNIIREAK